MILIYRSGIHLFTVNEQKVAGFNFVFGIFIQEKSDIPLFQIKKTIQTQL